MGSEHDDSPTLDVGCFGGGTAYVGHGNDCCLLAFTEDVKWWRNAVVLTPNAARHLAAILTEQADAAERCAREEALVTASRERET